VNRLLISQKEREN